MLGYKSSDKYADEWTKRYFKPNVEPSYKYMLCYVGDFLHIYCKPKEDMDGLNVIYRLNEGFVSPNRYLGVNVDKVQLKNGRVVCSNKCVDYLKSAIENFDDSLGVYKTALKNYLNDHRPYSSRFRPELYVTE